MNPILAFGIGYFTCAVVLWLTRRLGYPVEPDCGSNPPVCRHCGVAHPLGEQNPASDPVLRS